MGELPYELHKDSFFSCPSLVSTLILIKTVLRYHHHHHVILTNKPALAYKLLYRAIGPGLDLKAGLRFSIRNFVETVQRLKIGGLLILCLGKHVKP